MRKMVSLSVGDVITSEKFAYGKYDFDRTKVTVDGKTKTYPVGIGNKTIEYGAYDLTRAGAKFVVETAGMEGGGTGHGPNDVYGDGWHVRARRLQTNGEYDPNGEIIEFYTNGSFNCVIPPKDIRVVGKMQMWFVKVK